MNARLIITGLFVTGFLFAAKAQENIPTPPTPPTPPEAPVPPTPPEAPEGTENGDTTKLHFGKTTMLIIDNNEEKDGNSEVKNENDDDESDDHASWAGLGIGVNGLMTFDNTLTMTPENKFLELDYSKSITVNFNFAEKRFPVFREYVGITTGLGIQWNRYGFKNNYDISFNADSLYGVENTSVDYSKNVLKATYLQIPLLLEINTNKNQDKAFHLSVGVVGGYKLGSRLKTEWEMEGKDYKNKTKGHYHFNPFQANLTAIVGYNDISLYVNYGLTRVFEKGKGPQLYPVTAGILFNF